MIRIQSRYFVKAFRKAREVQPTVRRASEQEYDVRRSDGRFTRVVLMLHAGGLWAACGCYAGSPQGRNAPLPCYHVAAALLSDEPVIAGASAPAAAASPVRIHSHFCPGHHGLWQCGFQGCEALDDLHCDSCEQREIEKLDWSLAMAN